jgi:hypothetical protein
MRVARVRGLTSKYVLRRLDMLDGRVFVAADDQKGFRIASCLLIECEMAERVLFLGTKHKLGHLAAGPMVDALSMATLMRRIVRYVHGYSPSANLEAQEQRLGAELDRGAVRLQQMNRRPL